MLEKDVKDSYGVVPDIHTLLSPEVTFVGILPRRVYDFTWNSVPLNRTGITPDLMCDPRT